MIAKNKHQYWQQAKIKWLLKTNVLAIDNKINADSYKINNC